jgi:small multidrug resistance family-3 protein
VEDGMTELTRSIVLFVLAGLCEIGGGWLMWLWWRNGAAPGLGAALCLAGVAVIMYTPR